MKNLLEFELLPTYLVLLRIYPQFQVVGTTAKVEGVPVFIV
jgi:hypothetical protein